MKRFAAILLTGILSCAAAVPSFGAVNSNGSAWALPALEYAYEEGLITDAELQKAKSPMSRIEFCKMVMRFLQVTTGEARTAAQESPFTDCADTDVAAAYEAGIIGGVEPGIFAPDRTLTREQMAIMVARTLKVCGIDLTEQAQENPFTDTKGLYDSSNRYIDQLYGAKIVAGYQDNTYHPFREMTVQEAVASFVQAYRYVQENTEAEPEKETEGAVTQETENEQEKVTETNPDEQEKVTETNPDEQEKVTETALVSVEEMAQVFIGGKQIALGMTEEELKAVWGEPDRVDETLYRLDRYIYLNQYEDYFFATMENGRIVEIFIPGTNFVYLGTEGKGTSADIKDLDYISAVEHSGIIKSDTVEARIPLNYEGEISGLLLQTADFSLNKNPMSVLHLSLQEDLEAELVDIVQVKRKAAGLELVTTDGKLTSVARAHSEDMVKNSYFDYNSPDGTTPFARIMKEGKSFLTASEVIAKQRGDVVNIYQEWIRTSAKIGGLTDGTMQEIGVGVAGKSKELYVTVDLCGQSTKKK